MKIYDMEHHYLSQAYSDYIIDQGKKPEEISGQIHAVLQSFTFHSNNITGGSFSHELICKDDTDLKIMDEAGLQYGVVSTSDGIETLPKDICVDLSRKTNDATAQKAKDHPDRFLGTFCLPTPYVDEALKEIDRATGELGLKYFHTHSTYGKTRLSNEKYEPIIKKCAELDIPIYIHPAYQDDPYFASMGFAYAGAGLGFGVDVMKTFDELVIGGVFDRYPNLKIILGHLGEFTPYLLARMDNMIDIFRGQDPMIRCKKNFSEYIKNGNIFITTSGIFDETAVKFAMEQIGVDHIMFGADFPYENCKRSVDFVLNLDISDEDKEKICYKNAEKYILKL